MSQSDSPQTATPIPLLPLRDVVVFPHMVIPLFVGRDKSMQALERAMEADKRILLVAPTHVALDNVLERVGTRPGVTAIRLGSEKNVEAQAHRFLLANRCRDLAGQLSKEIRDAAGDDELAQDPVARVQREWAERIKGDDAIGAMLLLNANLLCATPIGIAMAPQESKEPAVQSVRAQLSLAWVIGPPLAFMLALNYGFTAMFSIAAGIFAISLTLIALTLPSVARVEQPADAFVATFIT